ncbi:MAG: hypothetical protein ACR2JB_24410 [Bryobacteraceae bacterium]
MTVLVSTGGAPVGSLCGGFLAFAASLRTQGLERLKLISAWTRSDEVEKLRITAYRELWRCLGGISTFNSGEQIVASLPEVQERLQRWYYDHGGGLFLTGSADQHDSTKAAFFAARDLRSEIPVEIWEVFHQVRRLVRRDVGIFASQLKEQEHLDSVKKKLGLN